MQIRWSPSAAADLESIISFVRRENPDAAYRIGRTLRQSIRRLRTFPRLGRSGPMNGTRELSVTGLPYLIVYKVDDKNQVVRIVRIMHGAQRWPPVN